MGENKYKTQSSPSDFDFSSVISIFWLVRLVLFFDDIIFFTYISSADTLVLVIFVASSMLDVSPIFDLSFEFFDSFTSP